MGAIATEDERVQEHAETSDMADGFDDQRGAFKPTKQLYNTGQSIILT